jgi:hypothetical protein
VGEDPARTNQLSESSRGHGLSGATDWIREAGVDEFLSLAAALSLGTLLALLVRYLAVVIVVKMVIKGVRPKQLEEVLIAISYLFSFRGERDGRNELDPPKPKPPDDTGQDPEK